MTTRRCWRRLRARTRCARSSSWTPGSCSPTSEGQGAAGGGCGAEEGGGHVGMGRAATPTRSWSFPLGCRVGVNRVQFLLESLADLDARWAGGGAMGWALERVQRARSRPLRVASWTLVAALRAACDDPPPNHCTSPPPAASAPAARACWCCAASLRRCCPVCSRCGLGVRPGSRPWCVGVCSHVLAGLTAVLPSHSCTPPTCVQEWGATHLCFESDTEPYAKQRCVAGRGGAADGLREPGAVALFWLRAPSTPPSLHPTCLQRCGGAAAGGGSGRGRALARQPHALREQRSTWWGRLTGGWRFVEPMSHAALPDLGPPCPPPPPLPAHVATGPSAAAGAQRRAPPADHAVLHQAGGRG